MERYCGEPLPKAPRIAMLVNDTLGNFCVATPLMVALHQRYPHLVLHYRGGAGTRELEVASDLIQGDVDTGAYDLLINLEREPRVMALAAEVDARFAMGPVAGLAFDDSPESRLWQDPHWTDAALTGRHPQLASGFIAEIFCRLAGFAPLANAPWPGGIPRYALPRQTAQTTPLVLVATGASLSEKLWPETKWRSLLQQLPHPPGLLGAPTRVQHHRYHSGSMEDRLVADGLVEDWRGRLTLPQVVDAVASCEQVISIDNGIVHIAAAFDVPTVGLFREGIHRLWAPPNPNLAVLYAPSGVADITVEDVLGHVGSV